MSSKVFKKIISPSFLIVTSLLVMSLFAATKSFAAVLENDVEVAPNSTLTYYLKVSYDGVDRNGVKSSDTVVSSIGSGEMYVEDKIPDGLIFNGFVTTDDGTVGAVKRGTTEACLGKVVDDTNEASNDTGVWNAGNTEYTYHGLHYTVSDRTVRFTVKNLKAGCELTVGIITTTPTIDDPNTVQVEKRRDFFNFASIREKALAIISNTVHVYMGNDSLTKYAVGYEYSGTVPENAPLLPTTLEYVEGATVSVQNSVSLEGYTFSGWTTTDAIIGADNTFTMPASGVILRGSFTPITTKNSVTYQIQGTAPRGYAIPKVKSYYPQEVVDVDALKVGDVVSGYRFSGWTTTDATISSDYDFVMPNTNVTLVGNFEEVKYNVTYQFYDTVLPPNAENYLPATSSYAPGETVTLATVNEPAGYKFLGWYKEDNFEMPNENVTIYGEWKKTAGTFEPTITKAVIGTKTSYGIGEKVKFSITVSNTASYKIHDVIVQELKENAKITEGSGYTVLSDHIASIAEIPANSSKVVYAEYIVQKEDHGTIINTSEMVGALADNDYELKDKDYTATANFNIQSQVKICNHVTGITSDNTFQFNIKDGNNLNTWIGLKDGECKTVSLPAGTYTISEIVPQEFTLESVTGAITSNGGNLVVLDDNSYEVTFNNRFVKKGFLHSTGRVVNEIKGGE